MSKKEKSTILFSRNGIKIEKIEFLDMTKYENKKDNNSCFKETYTSILDTKEIIKGKPAWDEKIRKESVLGFYYYWTIHHSATQDRYIEDTATYVKYIAKFGNTRYEFIYPTSYNNVSINKETRPWDILPGYKGIPDHFITDLYKEINKMFDVFESERIPFRIMKGTYSTQWKDQYSSDMSWIKTEKNRIFLDIFGDTKGPEGLVNYNDIKIMSHGFDLKESFRKRKES